MVDSRRIRELRDGDVGSGPVIYWMSRDQRIRDNWALLAAQEKALELQRPLVVVFCLVDYFLNAGARQYAFMLSGLTELSEEAVALNVPFVLLRGNPGEEVSRFASDRGAAEIYTDFDPLRIKREWKMNVLANVTCPVVEGDAHNIVPVWEASSKREFGAYTLRPKIKRVLEEYLVEIPHLERHPYDSGMESSAIRPETLLRELPLDWGVAPVNWLQPGSKAAVGHLQTCIRERLQRYASDRNDPNLNGVSGLSPYLHFGQISSQRVALEIKGADAPQEAKDALLEELIVRRELADNFCFHTDDYDSISCCPDWSAKTLAAHRDDPREYVYSQEQFEGAETHEALWNACQRDMMQRGKLHGFLRMYWAKKILEWSASPEEALAITNYLNDKYELDGRDPNGYNGSAWAICGVHDRAWSERPVFGKIRYMNLNGCKRKFDVEAYVARLNEAG